MTLPSFRIDRGIRRGQAISITVDGQELLAFEGETIAAAIICAGRRTLRFSTKHNEPRSLFCGIGVCHECRMVVDGNINVQACITKVRAGMIVDTQHGLGEPLS